MSELLTVTSKKCKKKKNIKKKNTFLVRFNFDRRSTSNTAGVNQLTFHQQVTGTK